MNLIRRMFQRRDTGTERSMPENNAANPAAGSAGLTKDELNAIVAGAVAAAIKPLAEAQAQLVQSHKALAETVAAQPGGDQAKKTQVTEGAKALTLEDVTKVVTDALGKQQKDAQQVAARDQFVSTRLKNFPPAYQARLGNDPAKWEAEAATIADEFKADIGKFGGKLPDVGGDNPGGKSPAAAQPDLEKQSPTNLIAMGLKAGETAANKAPATATA